MKKKKQIIFEKIQRSLLCAVVDTRFLETEVDTRDANLIH